MGALTGLRVLDLSRVLAGPWCGQILADLGAEVIKIERPGVGDFARGYDERVRGLASHFVWTNRSKESLTLDVKHPEAQKILQRLVSEQTLAAARDALEAAGLKADNAEVSMIPSTKADMDAETAPKLLRLIDMLEDCDDVQEVYHNGEISDEVAATL